MTAVKKSAEHHRAVKASVALGSWMSAALDDPNVCKEMKTDILEWFSAGEPFGMNAFPTLITAFKELEGERDRLREELARASRGAENMATILELSPPPMEKTIEVLRAIASHAAAALEPKP